MNSFTSESILNVYITRFISIFLTVVLFGCPIYAQQPTSAPAKVAAPEAARKADPTFDTLLSTDSYKLYGEVRNVGQLLTTGGAGEIVDPIIKLADPGPQFKSVVKFLKTNSEALATSRLMFAAWPARTGIPTGFVAIEYGSTDEASKFAPKLETFLPTVLPPVPIEPEVRTDTATAPKVQSPAPPTAPAAPTPKPEELLPFVITHRGNLVFITDKPFKFEKLRPQTSALLSEDHNFRVARDRFSSEPVFLFVNVALEDRTRPKPSPTPTISEEERQQMEREAEARMQKEIEQDEANARARGSTNSELTATVDAQPG